MSSCPKCKAELPAEARYCNKCGSPQIKVEPKIDAVQLLAEPRGLTSNPVQVSVSSQNDKKTRNASSLIRPIEVKSSLRHPANPPSTGQVHGETPAPLNKSPLIPPQLGALSPKTSRRLSSYTRHSIISSSTPVEVAAQNGHTLPEQTIQLASDAAAPQESRLQENESAVSKFRQVEIVRGSTRPNRRKSSTGDTSTGQEEISIEKLAGEQISLEQFTFEGSSESFAATSKAAEHWRNSWRERQYAEVGPAGEVSRGQAVVPMPLLAMQNSFVRLRAILVNNKQSQLVQNLNLSFWVTFFLMICLIGGLGVYIISTFLPASPFGAARIASPEDSAQPTMMLEGPQAATVLGGQALHIHGEHFDANDTILFTLDSTMPILKTNGKPLYVRTNSAGSFVATLSVSSSWLVGSHLIQAQASRSKLSAYLNIEVVLGGTPSTTSPNVVVSIQQLTFTTVFGEGNPAPQKISFTNSSGSLLQWSVTAAVDGNLSWLTIDQKQISGILEISATDTISVTALATGLVSTPHPYEGHIIFTLNNSEQLTIPVELSVLDRVAEMVLNPDPMYVQLGPNNTCKTDANMTLINLSDAVITWNVVPDETSIIKFLSNGQPVTQGELEPSGTLDQVSGKRMDTTSLTLICSGVQAGMKYHITFGANGITRSTYVIIRP